MSQKSKILFYKIIILTILIIISHNPQIGANKKNDNDNFVINRLFFLRFIKSKLKFNK